MNYKAYTFVSSDLLGHWLGQKNVLVNIKMTGKKLKINQKQFLASIITTLGSDWRAEIKAIDRLKIKRIALFLTCVKVGERKQLYKLLEATGLREVPFVHMRSDMEPWELDYLQKKWKTKVFNTHTQREFPFLYNLAKHHKRIFIENVYTGLLDSDLDGYAGVCLDFSHLENDRLNENPRFKAVTAILLKHPIGCNHISAIKKTAVQITDKNRTELRYDRHFSSDLSDFDYLKNYPAHYFSPYCAIELENPLKEQLEAIDCIAKILNLKS